MGGLVILGLSHWRPVALLLVVNRVALVMVILGVDQLDHCFQKISLIVNGHR